jgi:protein-disulfide isomerase
MSPKFESLATPLAVLASAAFIAGALVWNNAHPNYSTKETSGQPPAQTVDASKIATDGDPFIGRPEAPVIIAYWYDYQCPFCRRNEAEALPKLIKEYVDPGKVKIVFKDFQFLSADSQTLGRYSRGVWQTVPEKFYAWHKAVYDNQGAENTGWATADVIRKITAEAIGETATEKVIGLVEANSGEYQREMDADKAEGASLGINGTPSFIIGKQLVSGAVPYEQLKAAVEAARK